MAEMATNWTIVRARPAWAELVYLTRFGGRLRAVVEGAWHVLVSTSPIPARRGMRVRTI
jgi:hypothetical protein